MGIKLLENSVNGIADVKSYLIDKEADLQKMPSCGPGSTALYVSDAGTKVYIKNTEGNWILL